MNNFTNHHLTVLYCTKVIFNVPFSQTSLLHDRCIHVWCWHITFRLAKQIYFDSNNCFHCKENERIPVYRQVHQNPTREMSSAKKTPMQITMFLKHKNDLNPHSTKWWSASNNAMPAFSLWLLFISLHCVSIYQWFLI